MVSYLHAVLMARISEQRAAADERHQPDNRRGISEYHPILLYGVCVCVRAHVCVCVCVCVSLSVCADHSFMHMYGGGGVCVCVCVPSDILPANGDKQADAATHIVLNKQ